MSTVLDYSAGTPGAKAIKGFGAVGVVRYAGTPGRRKNLTKAEFADLDRAGLGVATVYENKAGDYLGGYAAGQRAARAWLADVSSIDERLTRVGFFAVDRDVVSEWATLADYFRGINSVIGVARTRGYGEADVVDYLVAHGLASGGQWQTVAWSHSRRSPHAALFQNAHQPAVGGIACDINDVLAPDWGQHNHEEDELSEKAEQQIYSTYAGLFIGSHGGKGAGAWTAPPIAPTLAKIAAAVPGLQAGLNKMADAYATLAAQQTGDLTADQLRAEITQLSAELRQAVADGMKDGVQVTVEVPGFEPPADDDTAADVSAAEQEDANA